MHSPTIKWHILGPGAMGCLFATYFQKNNYAIKLIAKQKTHWQGAIVAELPEGELNIPCDLSLASDIQSPIDYLLVATKAHAVNEALESVIARLHENSVVVLVQNGIGSYEKAVEAFPALNFLVGLTTCAAYRRAPYSIIETGKGQLFLGDPTGNLSTELMQRAQEALNLQHVNLVWDHSIQQRRWEKFAVNCVINGLTSLFQCRNGELLKDNHYKSLVDNLIDEVSAVFLAHEIIIPKTTLQKWVYKVAKETAENYSSMLQDVHHKKPTEIAYINGYLKNLAQSYGVLTPVNDRIVEELAR